MMLNVFSCACLPSLYPLQWKDFSYFCPFSFFATLFIYFFNWRIIALPNFVVFCHISTRISHRYTHVSSLLNSFCLPSQPTLLDCHRVPVWVPWITCKFPLVIYFTYGIVNFHVTLFILLTLSLLPSLCVHRSGLYVFPHSWPENKLINTIFLDST